jgi:hypothetical protein
MNTEKLGKSYKTKLPEFEKLLTQIGLLSTNPTIVTVSTISITIALIKILIAACDSW